ncbi:MAG: hypothetical protein U0074_05340 [Kouleothrix sp.]
MISGKPTEDERFVGYAAYAPRFHAWTHGACCAIAGEFVEGFDALAGFGDAVTLFGSARVREGDGV